MAIGCATIEAQQFLRALVETWGESPCTSSDVNSLAKRVGICHPSPGVSHATLVRHPARALGGGWIYNFSTSTTDHAHWGPLGIAKNLIA